MHGFSRYIDHITSNIMHFHYINNTSSLVTSIRQIPQLYLDDKICGGDSADVLAPGWMVAMKTHHSFPPLDWTETHCFSQYIGHITSNIMHLHDM